MATHFYNNIAKYLILTLVALVISLAPFSPTFQYQKAEAGGGLSGGATELTQIGNNLLLGAGNAINSISAWATNLLQLKEFTLDGFAWFAINAILEEMIRSVTAWVNAGFPGGGPAFVRDLKGFLLNVADGIAGDFILNNTNLGFMCSPFQLDIQFALTGQYLANRDALGYQPQCRISSVLQNIKNFTVNVNGQVDLNAAYDSTTFAAGGWAWWMSATENQENNVFGAYAKAQSALNVALRNAKGEEIKLLEFGQGFLSRKECDASGKNCKIVTPGQVIETQLDEVLSGGQKRLTVADEINELIGALLSQLVTHVLGGSGLFNASIQPFQDPNTGTTYNSLIDSLSNSSAFGGYSATAGTPPATIPTTVSRPAVSLSASSTRISAGRGTTNVTWTVTGGATNCVKTGNWSGSANINGGSSVFGPTNRTRSTLGINCTNSYGATSDSIIITAF